MFINYGQIVHDRDVYRDMCLHSPWTAGISGIVKPFNQLRVRGHSNFNHIGVRFHLEGPIMSTEQTEQFQVLLQAGNYDDSLMHSFSVSVLSPNISDAKISSLWLIKYHSSEWRLINVVQKWQFNNPATLCSNIKFHLCSPSPEYFISRQHEILIC